QARQRSVIGRHPPLQDLLRKWGAIVGLVGLSSNNGQMPPEALLAQGFRGTKSGQRRADDDDPAVGLELLDQCINNCLDAHACFPASVSPSCSSTIACTGQAATERITRRRSASSGLGSYLRASSPCSSNTSGARKTHCANPWQRFMSTTSR